MTDFLRPDKDKEDPLHCRTQSLLTGPIGFETKTERPFVLLEVSERITQDRGDSKQLVLSVVKPRESTPRSPCVRNSETDGTFGRTRNVPVVCYRGSEQNRKRRS